jgi:hypothetical protein
MSKLNTDDLSNFFGEKNEITDKSFEEIQTIINNSQTNS